MCVMKLKEMHLYIDSERFAAVSLMCTNMKGKDLDFHVLLTFCKDDKAHDCLKQSHNFGEGFGPLFLNCKP